MNAPLTLPRPSETAAEAYAAAFRGRDLASIRELQRLRGGLNEGQQFAMDCLAGSGYSAEEIVGGDAEAARRVREQYEAACGVLAGSAVAS
jgi:hypothetical protein